jgi:hypothetical protein
MKTATSRGLKTTCSTWIAPFRSGPAVFLRREVEDVERKAFERNRPTWVDCGDTTASIGRMREPLSRSGRDR